MVAPAPEVAAGWLINKTPSRHRSHVARWASTSRRRTGSSSSPLWAAGVSGGGVPGQFFLDSHAKPADAFLDAAPRKADRSAGGHLFDGPALEKIESVYQPVAFREADPLDQTRDPPAHLFRLCRMLGASLSTCYQVPELLSLSRSLTGPHRLIESRRSRRGLLGAPSRAMIPYQLSCQPLMLR